MMTTTVEARRSEGVLLPQHAALIEASGISPEVAQARGYWSAQRKSELRRLGFSDSQCLSPALVVPVWNVLGELATYQIRPDQPRINSDGKAVKYETPGGSRMALDVPPLIRETGRSERAAMDHGGSAEGRFGRKRRPLLHRATRGLELARHE